MKESYIEGIAIHDDPESCAVSRKAAREALTGAHAGSVLSREIRSTRAPTLLSEAEGHISQRRYRESLRWPCAVADPMHVWNLLRENREIP